MLAVRHILVAVAVLFPRPEVVEDFIDLIVGFFAALSGATFKKLGEIVNVLSGAVGERRQPVHVPTKVNEFHAAVVYRPVFSTRRRLALVSGVSGAK